MNRPSVGVGVILHDGQGRIVLGKRDKSHGSGEWSMPGGHLEWGENFQECCAREVEEETGIIIGNVEPIQFTNDLFWYPDWTVEKHYVTLFFIAERVTGEPVQKEDKFLTPKWFGLESLPSPLFPPLAKLLKTEVSEMSMGTRILSSVMRHAGDRR
jgi:8-oxo-dGTP diphosphatase